METDRELSAFAGQFVPLKIKTDGSGEWGRWSSQYPPEGRGIPIVYVIRADGEKLYGKSGSLPGPELPNLLLASLQQSGRVLNDAETQRLGECVEQADKALADQDQRGAAKALSSLAKFGTPGDLKSYSELAVRADVLFKTFHETAEKSVATAQEGLKDTENAFAGVLTLVEAEDIYGAFPTLKASAVTALREVDRNSDLSPLRTQADALHRARRLGDASQPLVRKKAATYYEQVIARFPGTQAAQLATAELAQIDPNSPALTGESPAAAPSNGDAFRTWTDATGNFSTEAKLTGYKQGWVRLEKHDGKTLTIPAKKLSKRDQDFLETHALHEKGT